MLIVAIDVESIGLHGEAFAVGYSLREADGRESAAGWLACPPQAARGADADRRWVAENVPAIAANCESPSALRVAFWALWMGWRAQGRVMVSDVAWPVEAGFLSRCVADDPAARAFQGPYPLLDVAVIEAALAGTPGLAPVTVPRQADELPAHHPLADARYAGRRWYLLQRSLSPPARA